jgi:hypothetical protein
MNMSKTRGLVVFTVTRHLVKVGKIYWEQNKYIGGLHANDYHDNNEKKWERRKRDKSKLQATKVTRKKEENVKKKHGLGRKQVILQTTPSSTWKEIQKGRIFNVGIYVTKHTRRALPIILFKPQKWEATKENKLQSKTTKQKTKNNIQTINIYKTQKETIKLKQTGNV